MKINILRGILLVFIVCTCIIIFNFSNQSGKESGNLSEEITQKIINLFSKIENKEALMEKTEKIIRKVAHFSIYTILGFLLMAFVSTYDINGKLRIGISFLLGLMYAISDEIHQYFVPGRAAMLTDVIIDSFGVLFGISIVMLVLEIRKKIIQKIIRSREKVIRD